MKKFIALILVLILILPVMTFGTFTASAANPHEANLHAFWSFNEVVHDVMVADGMGRFHGLLRRGATTVNDPDRGTVLALVGSENQYVHLADGLLDGLDAMTVTVWYNWQDKREPRNWTRVFDFGNNTDNFFFFTPHSGYGNIMSESRVGGMGNANTRLTHDTPIEDTWTHVALAVGNGRAALYLNGELIEEGDFASSPGEMGLNTNNFIGRAQFADPLFWGLIDDLAVYNTVLTQAQIQEVMNHSFSTPASAIATVVAPEGRRVANTTPNADGVIAHFTFNEIVDGFVFDHINGNHGQVINGGSIVNDATRGPVLSLHGPDLHYIEMPDGILADADAVTLSVWYKWTDEDDSHWTRIVDIGQGPPDNIFLTPRSGHDTMLLETRHEGTPAHRTEAGFSIFNEWVHLAGTIGDGVSRIYLNGELMDENDTEFIPRIMGHTEQNWIGRSQYPDAHFTGLIDDLVIFNRVLSEAEIRALMNQDFRDVRGGPQAAAPAAVEQPEVPAVPVVQAPVAATTAPRTADPITLIAVGAIVSAAGLIIAKKRK